MPEYNPVCKFDTVDVGFDVGAFDKTILIDIEAFSISEAVSTTGVKSLAEILNITDGIVVKLSLTQALQVADSFTRSAKQLVGEGINISDTILKSGIKKIGEGLHIADTFTKSVVKFLSESFVIEDAIKFRLLLAETLKITDALLRSGTKLLSQSFSIIDRVSFKFPTWEYLHISESLHIADSFLLKAKSKFYETIKIVDLVFRKIKMIIRKITIKVRGGSYESDIELEDRKED